MSTPLPPGLMRSLLNQSLFVDSVAAAAGLRRIDLDALLWLHLFGESTAGELVSGLGLSSGGTSGVVDRLERDRLVERGGDVEDRRRVLIRITAEGEDLLTNAFAPLRTAVEEHLSPGEQESLTTLSTALKAALVNARAATSHRSEPEVPGELDGDYSVGLQGRGRCQAQFSARFSHLAVGVLEPGSELLFHARLAAGARVRVAEEAVGFIGRRSPFGAAPEGTISLNRSIPWSLRFPGGAMSVSADLRDTQVDTIEIAGGNNKLALMLGEHATRIRITGGANRIELGLPAGMGISVASRGGTTRVESNNQSRRMVGVGRWSLEADGNRPTIEVVARGGTSTFVVKPS